MDKELIPKQRRPSALIRAKRVYHQPNPLSTYGGREICRVCGAERRPKSTDSRWKNRYVPMPYCQGKGEQHHPLCTMHEDYVHDCSKEGLQYIKVSFSPPCWLIQIWQYDGGRHYVKEVRIDFCPWCGDDLGRPECTCAEIDEEAKAEAAERKAAN